MVDLCWLHSQWHTMGKWMYSKWVFHGHNNIYIYISIKILHYNQWWPICMWPPWVYRNPGYKWYTIKSINQHIIKSHVPRISPYRRPGLASVGSWGSWESASVPAMRSVFLIRVPGRNPGSKIHCVSHDQTQILPVASNETNAIFQKIDESWCKKWGFNKQLFFIPVLDAWYLGVSKTSNSPNRMVHGVV